MFGMGFAEILIIGVIAILFLGPDKLPETMVQIAKFFRNMKRTVASARETLDEELQINELKEGMGNYKKELTEASAELERMTNVDEIKNEINDVKKEAKVDVAKTETPSAPAQPEVVTFEKRKKTIEPKEENS